MCKIQLNIIDLIYGNGFSVAYFPNYSELLKDCLVFQLHDQTTFIFKIFQGSLLDKCYRSDNHNKKVVHQYLIHALTHPFLRETVAVRE